MMPLYDSEWTRYYAMPHEWNKQPVYVICIDFIEQKGYVEMNDVPEGLRHLMIPIEEINSVRTKGEEPYVESGTVAMFRSRYDAERIAACIRIIELSEGETDDA